MNSPLPLTAAEDMRLIRYAAVVMEITSQAILNQEELDVWEMGEKGLDGTREKKIHL